MNIVFLKGSDVTEYNLGCLLNDHVVSEIANYGMLQKQLGLIHES